VSSNLSSSFPQFNFEMSKGIGHSIYEFDRFRLDGDRLMLYRDEAEVALPPKAVETLLVLARNHGEIISKEDLIEAVWNDSIVEESNLSQYLYLLRKTLGKRPDGDPYIETLRRRGYRFNADVRSVRVEHFNGQSPAIDPPRFHALREGNVLRVAEWAPAASIEPSIETESPSEMLPKRRLVYPFLLACFAVAAIAGGGFLTYFLPSSAPVVVGADKREVTITKLTNGDFVWGATISSDGNYFVYSEIDDERSRLFVQQTGQNSRVELVSMPNHVVAGTTFSPDGRWIYFLATRKGENNGHLFRIPTIGGSPTKLRSGTFSTISFSPDGQEIAFLRVDAADDSSIVIADKDGRAERVLVKRHGLVTIGSSAAWSPDGARIVFSEIDRTSVPVVSRLKVVDPSTGIVSPLSDEPWDMVTRIEWIPDGSGIVTVGTRTVDRATPMYHYNVYHVSYPAGVSRRITNDGNRHETSSIGITKDGALLAVPSTRTCQIWSMKATGDAATAVQLTRGSADGRAGLVSLPDGRIGYTARTAENLTIWVAKEDGSEAEPLSTGFDFNEELRADPAGRFLVFSSTRDSTHHLFRINPDGSDLKQLTFGKTHEIDSAISPNGKTIVTYSEDPSTNPPKRVLKKLPADGGEPQVLAIENCMSPVFSPDGSMLSCVRNDGTGAVIITASDGRELESLPFQPGTVANFGAVWLPDSTGLVVLTHAKGTVSNLTVIPRDGRKPYNLTNFTSGTIYRFAFSHDGSRLFIARGYPTQHAVLIRNAF
jgi:DNA-binding winged helix-turn-helix (wHTH) protein/Tol biopolymer transport system component